MTSPPPQQQHQESESSEMTLLPKLRLQNIPKHAQSKVVKKWLVEQGLDDFVKVKKAPKWDYCFLTFPNLESKNSARNKLLEKGGGLIWKKGTNSLSVQIKEVSEMRSRDAEPTVRKRKFSDPEMEKKKLPEILEWCFEKLANQVTPLHNLSYEEQLAKKTETVAEIWKHFNRDLTKLTGIKKESTATILPIIASPLIEGYRNKVEFTCGLNEWIPLKENNNSGDDDDEIRKSRLTVGFLAGLYRDGIVTVLDPSRCKHIGPKSKSIAAALQEYLRNENEFPVYDRVKKIGVWRTVMVREMSQQVMALMQINPTGLSVEQVAKIKSDLIRIFQAQGVHTLLLQLWAGVSNGIVETAPLECLFGPGYVTEELRGLTFRISPMAFFQVNSACTELLYQECADWLGVNSQVAVLDLCCGTGTIGLCMAKNAKHVYGVEMIASAVEDAKHNAQLNQVENATYLCAKVEDAMSKVLELSNKEDEIVGILDPPRSGVHSKVIQAIRKHEALRRLVYVSCDARAATQNWIDLCRPSSNKYLGIPFEATRMRAVDLFPHTPHCEVMVEFRRQRMQ